MKKLFATKALALSAAALLAFVSCGGKKDSASASAASSSGSASAAAGGKRVIKIYRATYNTSAVDEKEVAAVQDAMNARLGELGADYVVDIRDIMNGEYGDKANMALAGGEVDLLWTANWWATIGTNDLYKGNAAYDLTSLLPGTRLWNSMPAWYWEAARYDGKDMFVPVYKEGAEGYMIKVLLSAADRIGGVDMKKIENAGPTTYDRLKALEPYMAKAVGKVKYPFVFAGTAMFYRFYLDRYDCIDNGLMSMIGVDQQTNELVNTVQSKEFEQYCTMMAEWGEKGYVNVDDELGGIANTQTCLTQDWLFNWWTAIPNNKESEGRDGNQPEDFAQVTKNWGRSTTTLGSCFAVSKKCSEQTAKDCVDFLGYLFTDTKLANLYTYGIEGKDYVITNGLVDRTGGTATYSHSPWESTSVKAVTLEVNEPSNKVEMYDDFNNNASGTVASGFRFDHSSVDAAYSACVNLFEEYGKSLELGAFGSKNVKAKIAEFQKKLDDAGYQSVLAEAQKQYNAWKASK